jgi:hypothetical protein
MDKVVRVRIEDGAFKRDDNYQNLVIISMLIWLVVFSFLIAHT